MTQGIQAYANTYDKRAKTRIAKMDTKYMLTGWYNSLIINKSYSTAYLYIHYVSNFCETIDNVNEITIDDYAGYLASLKMKASSVQIDAYHALQKYSKYLKAKGICEDYMQYVDRPKAIEMESTKEKREKGYLTKTEAKKLLNNCMERPGHLRTLGNEWLTRDYAIITLFLNTGIRCAAMYKLDVSDINFEEQTIRVFEKGSKARRLNVSDAVCDALRTWMKNREKILNGKKETALFISNRKNRMSQMQYYQMLKSIGADIKGKSISPHKLRATFGTQLYNKTHDVYFVQQAMGHSNPKTTEIYIRGQKNETSKKASDLMAGFID